MKIDKFDIEINREKVFDRLDIKKDTAAYEEASSLFEKCREIFYKCALPVCFYELKNKKTGDYNYSIFVLMSIGGNIEDVINGFFSEGEYFKGFILNGICDDFLIQMDKIAANEISAFICDKNLGFGERFYPHENIKAEIMKEIVENTQGYKMGITVNESCVLSPAKSVGFIMGADFNADNDINHSCVGCKRKDCRWRETNA